MLISRKMEKMVGGNTAIRQMFEEGLRMARKYGAENVYDFSLGNPNVPAPPAVNESIRRLVDTVDSVQLHGYMPNAGYPAVRAAVAESLNRRFGTDYGADNIVMSVGAASAMNAVLKTILDPDDEVITFRPFFVDYNNYVENYSGKLVLAETDEKFLPDMEKLEKLYSPRTKAVLINNPNNPTGVIYPAEVIQALADSMRRAQERFGTQIMLISDEPYRELAYDGLEVPYVTHFYDNAVVCYSYSKSLSLPGERIGYVAVPKSVYRWEDIVSGIIISSRVLGMINAPSLMQHVILECLDTDISQNVAVYDKHRQLLYRILTENGFEAVYPQGAFYMWIKAPIEESAFVELCKKHRILVVIGKAFYGEGYVRAAYCVSEDCIRNSAPSWKAVAEELGLKKKEA